MKLPTLRLRSRIVIAVVAVAAVHAAFWVAPRWWATRPRFYEDAWREAVAVLEEEIGPAAVEKRVAYIEKKPVCIPYRGQITVTSYFGSSPPFLHFCLAFDSAEAWLLFDYPPESGIEATRFAAAKLSGAQARHVWAVLSYLNNAEGPLAEVVQTFSQPYHMSDRTWSRGTPPLDTTSTAKLNAPFNEFQPDSGEAQDRSGISAIRDANTPCAVCFLEHLASDGEIHLSESPEVVCPAIEALLRASLPPVVWADGIRLEQLTLGYAHLAGADALPLIRRIADTNKLSADYWLWHIRPIRTLFHLKPRWRVNYGYTRALTGVIWRIELSQLPRDEVLATAKTAAFEDKSPLVRRAAQEYLAEKEPRFLRENLLDYAKGLDERKSEGLLLNALLWFPDDRELAVALSEDEDPSYRIDGLALRMRRFSDPEAVEALKTIAASPANSASLRDSAVLALTEAWLIGVHVGDVPAFLRSLAEGQPTETTDEAMPTHGYDGPGGVGRALARIGGRENLEFFTRALRGEAPGIPPMDAAMALSTRFHRENVAPVLIEFLEKYAENASPEVQQFVASVLALVATEESVPDMERLIDKYRGGELQAPAGMAAGEPERALGYAVLAAKMRAADEPLAFLLSLPENERSIIKQYCQSAFERCTSEHLLEMLADDEAAPYMAEIYAALVRRRRDAATSAGE